MSTDIISRAAAAALVLTLAACSSSSPATPATSVSAAFAGGTARVQITSPASISYPAQLITGRLYNNGSALSVEYGTVQTGSLTYAGPGQPGTYKTMRTDTAIVSLALVAVITGAGGAVPYQTFSSIAGECSITISKMDATGGDATFTCSALPNADGTVKIDATGTFTVTP